MSQDRASTSPGRAAALVRLVIADDHPVIVHGVRTVLAHAKAPQYSIVAEEGNVTATVRAVQRLKPDVLLLDVNMPPGDGLDALEPCLASHPPLAVVVFSVHREVEYIRRAVTAGARGYVLKDAPAGELLAALRLAVRGSTYLPPGAARSLMNDPRSTQPIELDARERAILELIALGYTGVEIAAELGISERTVKNHRARIAGRLGLHQRHELTRWALRHGLVDSDRAARPVGKRHGRLGPNTGGVQPKASPRRASLHGDESVTGRSSRQKGGPPP